MLFRKHSEEGWKEEEQIEEGARYQEIYHKPWWEKWIIENRKLHYFILIILFFVLIWAIGYYSGLWFHIGSLFIFGLILTIVEIFRIRRNMYYIVETRLAGDVITDPEGHKYVVQDTETKLIEIPDFAFADFEHYGTNGTPLPIQSSRVIFADYVDLDNKIIYHSSDLEFANVVLSAGANNEIIASRTAELKEIDNDIIEKALENLRTLQNAISKRIELGGNEKLWRPLLKIIEGKIKEIEEIKKLAEVDESILLSQEFEHTFRITPSVKRNLFLHYKNTIPDLRSALFLLQNNLREFADAIATAKLYSSLGRSMPLDIRRRIADVFEKLGYGDIFSLEKKEEVKEHVVKE